MQYTTTTHQIITEMMLRIVIFCNILISIAPSSAKIMEYTVSRTWDNQIPIESPVITITITPIPSSETVAGSNVQDKGLRITVDAPYFDDPKLPEEMTNVPRRVDGLWNYEVVEIFFSGRDENYLEIELGPKGHYLVYFLEGERKVTNYDLHLDSYWASVYDGKEGKRWKGEAFIPFHYLPPDVSKFNAYAIYKSNQERTYMSLFPVPPGEFTQPDFHRLKYFQPIDLN